MPDYHRLRGFHSKHFFLEVSAVLEVLADLMVPHMEKDIQERGRRREGDRGKKGVREKSREEGGKEGGRKRDRERERERERD
jgi:hypothetical protein